jgi:CrcB protein
VGGVIGALARTALEDSLPVHGGQWPWATFSVNIAGAALLGFSVGALHGRGDDSPYARAFTAAGLCGTLTTFSALMLELLRMLDASHLGLALAYASASLAAGLGAVTIAGAAGHRVRRKVAVTRA